MERGFFTADGAAWLQAAFAGIALVGIPGAFVVLAKELRNTYRVRCGPYFSVDGYSILWNLKISKGWFTKKHGARFVIWGEARGQPVETCRILGVADSGIMANVHIDQVGCATVNVGRWLAKRSFEVRISFPEPDTPAIYAEDRRVNFHHDIEYEDNFRLKDVLASKLLMIHFRVMVLMLLFVFATAVIAIRLLQMGISYG